MFDQFIRYRICEYELFPVAPTLIKVCVLATMFNFMSSQVPYLTV